MAMPMLAASAASTAIKLPDRLFFFFSTGWPTGRPDGTSAPAGRASPRA
jgi:hypothetical protein